MHKFTIISLVSLMILFWTGSLSSQEVLFNFDDIPVYTTLPVSLTVSGITAHLTATGQGYSIQNADVLGFTPPGFAGHIVYPNSISLSDLIIKFDNIITDFSIMYSPQELGCDDSATMRLTAYLNSSFVGTNTRTATFPGTWPVDTLRCSFSQGFDSVVVHYDSPPPTCQDYGTIFMADNMRVTPFNATGIVESEFPGTFLLIQNYPNPFNPSTSIKYQIPGISFISLKVYDVMGNEIATLVNEQKPAGTYNLTWSAENLPSGVYFYQIKALRLGRQAGDPSTSSEQVFIQTRKMILLK
jgi:hypothetical protein